MRRPWLRNWPIETVPLHPHMPFGLRPLHEYLDIWTDRHPDATLLNYYGRVVSYREMQELSRRFAWGLRQVGCQQGDRVAIYLQNCPQFYIAYLALSRLGAIAVPCNPMLREQELTYILSDAGASVLIAAANQAGIAGACAGNRARLVLTRYAEFLPAEPSPEPHSSIQDRDIPGLMVDRLRTKAIPFTELIGDPNYGTSGDDEDSTGVDNIAVILYTSGTTGYPKGCVHTFANIAYKSASYSTMMGIGEHTTHLAVMPICHVAGKLLTVDAAVLTGASVVLLSRWEPDSVIRAIDQYRPEVWWCTVDMVLEISRHPNVADFDLSSLHLTGCSGFAQPLTTEIAETWRGLTGAPLFELSYGLSETYTIDTFTRGLGQREPGFVGIPNHGVDIRVVVPGTLQDVHEGDEGEIAVKTPSMMKGYWNKPEETSSALRNGWLLTGDIGRMTEDGFVYFVSRARDIIKSSGYSVAPAEVERLLRQHPEVNEVVVLGIPDEKRGEAPFAFVVPRQAQPQEESGLGPILNEWCRQNMAKYKCPAGFVLLDKIPKNSVGKPLREELRRLLQKTALTEETHEDG